MYSYNCYYWNALKLFLYRYFKLLNNFYRLCLIRGIPPSSYIIFMIINNKIFNQISYNFVSMCNILPYYYIYQILTTFGNFLVGAT